MSIFSKPLTQRLHASYIIMSLIFFILVFIFYFVNSNFIKPHITDNCSFFGYFMLNFFNDFWAGFFIATLCNFLFILTKNLYIKSPLFYLILWVVESFIWEIIRPFILKVFNPLDKTPKALWGDVIIYGVGTFTAYAIFSLLNRILKEDKNEKSGKLS